MCILCQLPTNHETERMLIAGYLDPGSGYVFTSAIPLIIGFLGTIILSLGLFLKRSFFFFYRKKILTLILLIGIISVIIISVKYYLEGKEKVKNQTDKKVLILAVDGMDPKIVSKGIADKILPNLAKLKDSGYYSELQTTVPPQSPVAWASFITGSSPAKHKIYDFIGRNPDNYYLQLNFSDSPPHKWQIKPFWEYLTEKNSDYLKILIFGHPEK